MKRILTILLAACMLLGAIGCSKTESSATKTEEKDVQQLTTIGDTASFTVDNVETSFSEDKNAELADYKIVMVLAATIGVNPSHDACLQALQEKFKDDPGVQIDYLESQQTSDWEPNLIAASTSGYDLVLAFTAQMKDTLISVAERYPEQHYVSCDNTIVGHDNICSVMGNCNEGCFVAGVFAALLTTHTEINGINPQKKVAYVGGKDTPYALDGERGFLQGVAAVDPECEVNVIYGNSFTDPMGMKEWALAAFESGADVAYCMAGAGQYGAIEAAQESNCYLVGHDGDWDEAGAGVVATSFVRNLSAPVAQAIYDTRTGAWSGDSVYLATFSNGGLGYTNGDQFKSLIGAENFPAEIWEKMKPYMEDISNGTIRVDEYPDFRPYDRDTYTMHY